MPPASNLSFWPMYATKASLQNINVVWKPLPGSQTLAMSCPCNHILFHGTRGPGKTDSQLMKFRQNVGKGYGAFWRGIIFDREYKNLDDLVTKSKRWFSRFNDGARFLSGNGDFKWVWPTGEELLFRVAKNVKDYDDYHGHEYPFIGWNELTKYPSGDLYEAMCSTNRSSFRPKDYPLPDGSLLPPIPLVVFSTTNPHGPGHGWVKMRFIDPAPYGQVLRNTVNVFNPATQDYIDVTITQVAIFGSYKENIYLDPAYIAGLMGITDENKRKAWLWGDWDVIAGGAFDDLWRRDTHVVRRHQIPANWYIDRAFDWGSTDPFAVGWYAVSNGEELEFEDGSRVWYPKNSIIMFNEFYGTKKLGTNVGLKWSAKAVAVKIRDMEEEMMSEGWIEAPVMPGPADNQIRDVKESSEDTLEKKMADEGIRWTKSDKSKGSRKVGLQVMRDRLEASLLQNGPGMYYMDNCKATISILPTLPRSEKEPDDVDGESEEHVWDRDRYRILAGHNRMATKLNVKHPT